MEGHGHHLHLSSCHECLELENSTILSVKYASVENIPDLPDDNSEVNSVGETEADHNAGGLFDHSRKPPNVLVYTAGSQERFQTVSRLLSECINMENNIIYHLLPQQVLTDPWVENTRLLVLAEEEPLTPQLQACFLTYLSKGGRVLGLASSLCPAGICLEGRQRPQKQISTLAFTREDSVELELHLLASDKVYVRDIQGGGEVELWGELKSDVLHQRDMVIVRVTHEEDGGEAVLCQVKTRVYSRDENRTGRQTPPYTPNRYLVMLLNLRFGKQLNVRLVNVYCPLKMHKCGLCLLAEIYIYLSITQLTIKYNNCKDVLRFLLSNSIFQMLFAPSPKVHLEISPDSQQLASEGFNKLKVSNALRYEVLTEILTSLDISCKKTAVPPLSPVHLLATDQVRLELLIGLQGHFTVTGLLFG